MNATLAAAAVAASTASIAIALAVHTRVRGFLPEDWPGPGRKQHARPTPMVGAVPIALAIAAAVAFDHLPLAIGMGVLAAVGLHDDVAKDRAGRRRARTTGPVVDPDAGGTPWTVKLVAIVVAVALALPDTHPTAALGDRSMVELALAAALLFVTTNAVNFLDNHNGVAAAVAAVALLMTGSPLGALVAGATVGFLPFNWPRARAFLGDSGALPLGLASATLALAARDGAFWPAAALVALPLLDFTQVVLARIVIGVAPWVGDRRHLTHLLHQAGCPAWALAPLFAAIALGVAWACCRI